MKQLGIFSSSYPNANESSPVLFFCSGLRFVMGEKIAMRFDRFRHLYSMPKNITTPGPDTNVSNLGSDNQRCSCSTDPEIARPERALWCEALSQAITGCQLDSYTGRQDKRWLLSDSVYIGSYAWVCSMLQLPSDRIRAHVLRVLDSLN